MWEGPVDEGAGIVLELNAIDECQEVEQETRYRMLLVRWWISLARKSRVEETNGPACKHGYLGQCGRIQYPNGRTKDHRGHLNIIRYFN